jgi:hypothetical protein
VIQISDVTNSQPQNLNLGELLVRWQRRKQLPQLSEGDIEGLHSDPLPGGVRRPVFLRGPPPPPPLLSAERSHVAALLPAIHQRSYRNAASTSISIWSRTSVVTLMLPFARSDVIARSDYLQNLPALAVARHGIFSRRGATPDLYVLNFSGKGQI